jgi:cytochrome oxidase Cu insertion factor (SCO1/SenC/PrrC family)
MRKRRSNAVLFRILLAVLMLGAWTPLGSLSAAAQDQALPLKIKVGEKAPEFSLPSADAKTIRLTDFAGHIVLIDFYRGYW